MGLLDKCFCGRKCKKQGECTKSLQWAIKFEEEHKLKFVPISVRPDYPCEKEVK